MRWRIGAIGVFGALILLIPSPSLAASSTVAISEVQTGTSAGAGNEFIELYNQTDQAISLSGWYLDYRSASGSSWSHKALLGGSIPSHGFYLLSAGGYAISSDQTFSAGLSGTGGHIRLIDASSAVIDLVGWGTAIAAEGNHAAAAPSAGQSIERLPGRLNESGGNAVDSDDNAADFVLRTNPEPQTTLSPTEAPDLTITSLPVADEEAPEVVTYLPLIITELMIDPASPKSDSRDEFIELYNPNDQDVDLAGYTLRTGSGFRDFYILPSSLLLSHGYIVIYSSASHLGLTNSGGAAQLLDPAGVAVSQTETYSAAKSNQVWGYFDGVWKWTLAVTPGTDNVLEEPAVKDVQAASAVKTKVAPKVTKKSPKSTVKAAKPVAKKSAAPKPTLASLGNAVPKASNGAWLIIGLATLTIGYAIYEYRTDLQNRIYLARRKLSAWRANRPRSPRR